MNAYFLIKDWDDILRTIIYFHIAQGWNYMCWLTTNIDRTRSVATYTDIMTWYLTEYREILYLSLYILSCDSRTHAQVLRMNFFLFIFTLFIYVLSSYLWTRRLSILLQPPLDTVEPGMHRSCCVSSLLCSSRILPRYIPQRAMPLAQRNRLGIFFSKIFVAYSREQVYRATSSNIVNLT